MAERPIHMHPHGTGPPETVLDAFAADARVALAEALTLDGAPRRRALGEVAARWPSFLDAWARLSEQADDPVEAYAYARVGYHRGLDQLRQAGWRGSGYVRFEHPENQGFLRALDALRARAAAIGEDEEAARCAEFLLQLDPSLSGGLPQ